MASFATLPIEMKRMILENVYILDTSASTGQNLPISVRMVTFSPKAFKNGMAPAGSSTAAVSLVNREMFQLCKLMCCEIIDLRCLASNDIVTFKKMCDHVKQYRRYIRTLICPLITFQCLQDNEEPSKRESPRLKWAQLVNQILENLVWANIKKIELVLSYLPPLQDSPKPVVNHPWTRKTLQLIATFADVTSFLITADAPLLISEDLVLQAIGKMKFLSVVSLKNVSSKDEAIITSNAAQADTQPHQSGQRNKSKESDSKDLGSFLAGSSSLKNLSLTNSSCVNQRWGDHPWESTELETLTIKNCINLSPINLQVILKQLQHTLKEFIYCHTKNSELELIQAEQRTSTSSLSIPTKDMRFPKMISLSISGFSLEENVLVMFQNCPVLQVVTIDSPNIRVYIVGELIKNWSKLTFLDSNVRGGNGSMDLIIYCSRMGIQLEEAFY